MSSADCTNPVAGKAKYTKKELNAAMAFAKFLYDLWRESQKNEIMEMDTTIYDFGKQANN